jgi:uncharacterized protein YjgD (DUF1641 family)
MDLVNTDLSQKIDMLAEQVAYLTEQARLAEQARQSREELMETMLPVAKDAMRLASEQMEEVQEYLDPEDLVRMLKKLVRHGPQIEMLVDQLDSLTDMLDVARPMLREGVDKATALAGEFEKKGYFTFAQGGMRMMDNVVTSFGEDDVNRLGDNIVLILNTVKDMTQPEIMNFLRNTLLVASKEVEKPVSTSFLDLYRQMQDPAVRRGLALTMRVLKVVGDQAVPDGNGKK